jgi:hypothetical protein
MIPVSIFAIKNLNAELTKWKSMLAGAKFLIGVKNN